MGVESGPCSAGDLGVELAAQPGHGGLAAGRNHNDPPPEPGLARREAHDVRPNGDHERRLLKPAKHYLRPQGGGTRGNQGFTREGKRSAAAAA
jgi:hypothetical protein